jgi:hypothetical protein
MGSNELHEQPAEPVRHVNDQSVLVATEVEDLAVVADEVNAPAELPFDLVWALPARLTGDGEPDADRSLGLRMTLPEFLQRPAGDHLHGRRLIPCHQFGDKVGRVPVGLRRGRASRIALGQSLQGIAESGVLLWQTGDRWLPELRQLLDRSGSASTRESADTGPRRA